MRKYYLCILIFLFIIPIWGDDIIFFDDSPSEEYYDASWGYVNSPSQLERVGEKFPVSTEYYFQGQNSLKLSWTSESGGDWGIAVAGNGWPNHDVTTKDSISFYTFTDSMITSENLPLLYLEDITNNKTEKIKMSSYIGDIPSGEWYNVKVPLQPFFDNAGDADLTRIKTIFYGQDIADGNAHTMYLDEIRMVSEEVADTIIPAVPQNAKAIGYERHVVIEWEPVADEDLAGYNIYRKQPGGTYQKIGATSEDLPVYSDFHGEIGKTYYYTVSAYDQKNNESEKSEEVDATTESFDDQDLLDMTQEITFRYFWNYAHPVSGLARERYGGNPETTTTGGSGMGMMTIPVAIERGFITREEGADHILKMLNFLKDADRFHGAWPHWLNGSTGEVIAFSEKDDGGDLVETAYLAQGLLTIRKYFDRNNDTETEIRNLATNLWESIEWDWYRRTDDSFHLYWHWSPNYEWEMNMPIIGYNEAMIVYLLAIASPTHSVPASLYEDGWAGSNNYDNGESFYGITQDVGWDRGGPLFFTHYSFLGFDPRGIKDSHTNYFQNNKNITLINRAWCIDNPGEYDGYGKECWGLTASDDPLVGYLAHEPTPQNDNGTITPTAALSAFPYTPSESMQVLKHFYRDLGTEIVGALGFKDAFNQTEDWVASSYIAIDQAPIIIMIENYRTKLLWDNFMANARIDSALGAIGFVPDSTNNKVKNITTRPGNFRLLSNYPNPFNPGTNICYSIDKPGKVILSIFNINGQLVDRIEKYNDIPGKHQIYWEVKSQNDAELSSGIYFYQLQYKSEVRSNKMVLIK